MKQRDFTKDMEKGQQKFRPSACWSWSVGQRVAFLMGFFYVLLLEGDGFGWVFDGMEQEALNRNSTGNCGEDS